MVFNKKRAAEEKQIVEQIISYQEQAMLWLKNFLPNHIFDFSMPTVRLSYELRKKHFGRYPLDNIEQSRLLAIKKYQQEKITQKELLQKQAELAEKMKQLVIIEPMHAAYLPNNTIIYYIENIKLTAAKENYSLDEFLIRVAVHEVFHAVHYFLCGSKHWNNQTCPREWITTIKESLARYVEYTYLTENNLFAHIENMNFELQNDYKCAPSYPYAGAKKLILHQQANFKEVFRLSLKDWQAAYRVLDL